MTDSQPEPLDALPEPHEALTDAELESMLLDAAALPGRRALAAVTAIRTVLHRRAQRRRAVGFSEDHERALELVNATRSPDRQVSEVHPTWVGSILEDPAWAPLYASDEEIREAGVPGV